MHYDFTGTHPVTNVTVIGERYTIICKLKPFTDVNMSKERFLELLVDSQNFRKSFLSEMASSQYDTFR